MNLSSHFLTITLCKIISWRPLYDYKSNKSISPIPRECELRMLGPQGPYQSPKTAQNAPYITSRFLSYFVMVKIMMHCPKSIFKPTLPNRSMSFNFMDNEQYIWGSWGPVRALKVLKMSLLSIIFWGMVLDDENLVAVALIYFFIYSSLQIYLTTLKGP